MLPETIPSTSSVSVLVYKKYYRDSGHDKNKELVTEQLEWTLEVLEKSISLQILSN